MSVVMVRLQTSVLHLCPTPLYELTSCLLFYTTSIYRLGCSIFLGNFLKSYIPLKYQSFVNAMTKTLTIVCNKYKKRKIIFCVEVFHLTDIIWEAKSEKNHSTFKLHEYTCAIVHVGPTDKLISFVLSNTYSYFASTLTM